MRVEAFDFELDEALIALEPARPRDAARLLVIPADPATPFIDARVRDLADHLKPGDLLVVNDTRVIAAALTGVRERGGVLARIDATLLEPLDGTRWRALARPAKRLRPGDRIRFGTPERACGLATLWASVAARGPDGEVELVFDLAGPDLDRALEAVGAPPLPPYIARRRALTEADRDDYQTLFATCPGAVAAPTAGLHFTPGLVARLNARGINFVTITLHVGPATFLPVKVADTDRHAMHGEWGRVAAEAADAINATRAAGRRIVAVGSTALRLLETAAAEDGTVSSFAGTTRLFITPGYRFRAVDLMMTNFHLPRSTLFMLVAAFSGLKRMHAAYAHAVARRYRFFSYGDACLLERAG